MTHGTDGIDSITTYGTFGNGGGRGGAEPEPQYILKMFGEVVKTFRKRARLTQEQFAPLVGYSLETVASIEQGPCGSRLRTSPSARTACSTRSA